MRCQTSFRWVHLFRNPKAQVYLRQKQRNDLEISTLKVLISIEICLVNNIFVKNERVLHFAGLKVAQSIAKIYLVKYISIFE